MYIKTVWHQPGVHLHGQLFVGVSKLIPDSLKLLQFHRNSGVTSP